jgi:hypothetical protein
MPNYTASVSQLGGEVLGEKIIYERFQENSDIEVIHAQHQVIFIPTNADWHQAQLREGSYLGELLGESDSGFGIIFVQCVHWETLKSRSLKNTLTNKC